MSLYENIVIREPTNRQINERLLSAYDKMLREMNEATQMKVDEFVSNLTNSIKKIFPKSHVNIYSGTNLGSSITFKFALGKDKSEWTNGIRENDPLYHIFNIGWDSFTDNAFTKDKIEAEIIVGGSLKTIPEEGSYMAFGRTKIGWRKKTDTPEKIIIHFVNYFKKVKKVLMDNKDKLPKSDYELNKNKL